MTYQELLDAICHLGFESDVERPELFFTAAASAQRTLFDDLPVQTELRRYPIYLRPTSETEPAVLPGTPFVRALPAGSVSLVSTGRGTLRLTDGSRTALHPLSEGCELQLTLTEGGSVRVEADEPLVLRRLCIYQGYTGPLPAPSGEHAFPLTEADGTPLLPCGLPTLNGAPLPTARIREGVLYLPVTAAGEVCLPCRRTPRCPPTPSLSDTVDLPPETEHLAIVLVASFVWLDAEPERAQYFRALYREGMLRRRAERDFTSAAVCQDVLGW